MYRPHHVLTALLQEARREPKAALAQMASKDFLEAQLGHDGLGS